MDHIKEHFMKLRKSFNSESDRFPLGDNDLNVFFDGLPIDTGIITIAGESGMGKSRLLKTLLYNLSVVMKIPCGYFSMRKHDYREMDVFFAGAMGLSFSEMKEYDFKDIEEYNSAYSKLHESSLYYTPISNEYEVEIAAIKAMAYMAVRENAIRALFIDGFQQIKASQLQETDVRCREQLKAVELNRLSLELGIPIIVTSRLNWNFYDRESGGRPMLSDLAGIGDLQEISNMVISVFRPEAYGLRQDANGRDLCGTTEIAILKNDYGKCKNGTFFTDGPIFDYRYMFESNTL